MARSRNPARRRYDNSLRQEQAEATRQRILEAATEVLAEAEFAEFSVGKVAKAAGVSEPTIYRHFGSRDGLIEAFGAWLEQRYAHPGYPDSRAGVRGLASPLFRFFDNSGAMVRAALTHAASNELIKKPRAKRRKRMVDILVAGLEDAAEPSTRARAAVVTQLLNSRSFLGLRDEYGLTTEQAGTATDWALGKLLDALEAEGTSSDTRETADDGDADV